MQPHYPHIEIDLSAIEGNAFLILAKCTTSARRAGVSEADIDFFTTEARQEDYDHLIRVCMKWFTIN